MKLLRESVLLRVLRRLLAGRRDGARRSYMITVPAPLEQRPASGNVVELHRRTPIPDSRSSTHGGINALPTPGQRAQVSAR